MTTTIPEHTADQREALALYESLEGVRNLDRRAETCYEACGNLYDEPTIAKIASAENQYLRSRFKVSTLGTKLSKHGYYKLFRPILLKDGLNAYQEEKRDGSKTLRHLFFKYCGLNASEWVERNDTDRVISRLGNAQTLNPGEVIDKAIALVQSDDHWEIVAGLVALTGRRPHEIVARAKFGVDGDYQVIFEGQGKKRDEKPIFSIATLAPAELVVSTLGHLRKRTELKSLLKEVRANNPRDLVRQNDEIDRRTNKSINRAVKREFASVLPTREGETEGNCKALRAAYSAIATKRDIGDGSIGEQMLYAARLLGHFVGESPTDNDLKHITTTIGYSDYRVNGEVPHPTMPESIPYKKFPSIRVMPETKEQIARWSELWDCSYHEVIDRLVVTMIEKLVVPIEPEVQSEPTTSEDEEMTSSQTDSRLDALEAKFDTLTQMMERLVEGQTAQPQPAPTPTPKPQPTKRKVARDWSQVSNDELFGLGEYDRPARGTGASDERIARAVQAIIDHNDRFPAGDMTDKKWSLDKYAVRQLSGCNGQVVARWFDEHHGLVSDHNHKHGLTDLFHNRDSHQGKDISTEIQDLIESKKSVEILDRLWGNLGAIFGVNENDEG
ncbi:hypothetical protein IQ235_09440 [Oscillatoriales cyanobacterium LEGE 11467]|uniref:Telomere resolvase ResT/TelK catalytic domain-containing protein n=1 Tax=Zarconia navalis LEGE 11467 TaxID=1828826 RepID=A0A928Z724_9CYAN|nr:telomere resolvase [Zarconia navalis]MBE9041002.1 hypothetical protein [Zarconia navalis LEGE 11467]